MSDLIMSKFNDNGYVHLDNLLKPEDCSTLVNLLKKEIDNRGIKDIQCPTSKSIRDSEVFDTLLLDLLPYFEEASGKKLLPTYAYARWYEPGEILKIHNDRPSCEISATVTLGFEGNVWPIYMGKPSSEETDCNRVDASGNKLYVKDVGKVEMQVGDAVLYRGCDMYHWRDEYTQGKWQAQVFLHYVDANGPFKDWIYDKRPGLNIKSETDLTAWIYDDILTEKDCDMLIKLYTQAPDENGIIGGGVLDKSIRDVKRVLLPTYKGIGARLAAAGLDANSKRWQFDITHANQSEFLKYTEKGSKYTCHMDTLLSNSSQNLKECRKLTVLAFLNDDFKGGKFFLQTSHKKFYPPQKKGTVLVFPSFILHGVEDVEEGERYSVVTWMVGPWFK